MMKIYAIIIAMIMLCGVVIIGSSSDVLKTKEDTTTSVPAEISEQTNAEVQTVETVEQQDTPEWDDFDYAALSEEMAISQTPSVPTENAQVVSTSKLGAENWNPETRSWANTTTLISIQVCPTKVLYGKKLDCNGILYQDNNSDEQVNSGDTPIPLAQMHVLWDDGSIYRQFLSLFTKIEPEGGGDANATDGAWNVSINVTETALGLREIEFLYYGEWTTNGSYFYELNQSTTLTDPVYAPDDLGKLNTYYKLINQKYMIDDDGNHGVDEEFFDFTNSHPIPLPWPNGTNNPGPAHDCDTDGMVDEDVSAFICRTPYSKKMMVALWHLASLSAQLSQTSCVAGESYTTSGKVRDASVPSMSMGFKTLQVRFDGQLVGQTVAVKGFDSSNPLDEFSEYSFTYTVPKNTPPGIHKIEVLMAPEYNVTNNLYYEPVNVTKYIKVLRPTEIIFNDVNEDAWVYHTNLIYINGSIIDKYYYHNYGLKQGIQIMVGTENFAKKYPFYLYWTKGSTYIQKGPFYVNNTNASFSIPLVVPGDQDLGSVNVTMELKCTDTYYIPSKNYTEYVTRAHTSLDMWIDQNNNGERNDPDTYITRTEYVDENGKIHYWNTAHIKGQLIDIELSMPTRPVGVANQNVNLWWGYGESWQKQFVATTDDEGKFSIDVEIEYGHILGPVVIAATFSENPYSCYYDSSSYYDSDGDPFSVVAMTHITLNQAPAVKGEKVEMKGILYDDRNIGINNRTVTFYWLGSEKDKNNYDKDKNKLGQPVGSVSTDSVGRFKFTEFEVPRLQPVGPGYVVATFGGSQLYPNGLNGQKYTPTDAYSKSWSAAVGFTVSANTVLELEKTNAMKVVRYNKFTVKGRAWEGYHGEIQQIPIRGIPIEAYIIDSKNNEFFFGRELTFNEGLETDGAFQITGTVPREVTVGAAQVRVQFNGTEYYLESQNISMHEIWTDTEIKILEFPDDAKNDGRADIKQGDISLDNPLRVHIKIYEANTPVEEQKIPVEYGEIWMNVSAVNIVRQNSTRGVTDTNGRFVFNFTKPLRDSQYGTLFLNKEDYKKTQDVSVNITYTGGRFQNPTTISRDATVYPPDPPYVPPIYEQEIAGLTVTQWLIFLIVLIILFAIAMFFTVRWLKKRARIRGMKRIIKRAADQLVAGNEYTAVIFKSYQKLGAHLRKYGYLRRDSETFREFEDAVRQALPIDRVSMNEFLKLLEEARYSHHKIGEEQRNSAITNLRSIESSLERIILDESAAMKALETLDETPTVETEIVLTEGGPPGPPPGPHGPK